MCRFDTSICGCSLRTGSIIIVLYHLLFTWNLIFGCALLLQRETSDNPDYKLSGESESALQIFFIFGLFSNVMFLVLLIGVIKRIQVAAFVLLIYMSVWAFLTVSGVILAILISEKPFCAVALIPTVIDVYCWMIVYNFWMEIREEDEDF